MSKLVNKGQLKSIKRELTMRPMKDPYTKISIPFTIYKETDDSVVVPRNWRDPKVFPLRNKIPFPSFAGTLRHEQKIIVQKTVDCMKRTGGGLMCVRCGGGKTTMAIAAVAHFGVRTLVIVNKESLGNQWKERIHQFAPGSTVGTLRSNIVDVNHHWVIGMIQSLATHDYGEDIFDMFDCVIVDEAHHICAKVFSQAMLRFVRVSFTLSLSATPDHKSGLRNVLHLFTGGTIVDMRETRSDVEVIEKNYTCARFELPPPLNKRQDVDLVKMTRMLTEDEERNALIILVLHEYLLEQQNHILVLSALRDHCSHLHEMMGPELSGIYMGGMEEDALIEASAKRVVFATNRMADEGLDIPTLNILMMVTPKSDVVQACGRVLRGAGGPKIIDFRDKWSILNGMSRKRKNYYMSRKWIKSEEKIKKYMFID